MSFPVAGVKVLRNRQTLNYADCAIRQNLAGPNLRRQHSVRADYLSMDNIYADSDTSITDVSQIIDVFNNPDRSFNRLINNGNSGRIRTQVDRARYLLKKPASALNVAPKGVSSKNSQEMLVSDCQEVFSVPRRFNAIIYYHLRISNSRRYHARYLGFYLKGSNSCFSPNMMII